MKFRSIWSVILLSSLIMFGVIALFHGKVSGKVKTMVDSHTIPIANGSDRIIEVFAGEMNESRELIGSSKTSPQNVLLPQEVSSIQIPRDAKHSNGRRIGINIRVCSDSRTQALDQIGSTARCRGKTFGLPDFSKLAADQLEHQHYAFLIKGNPIDGYVISESSGPRESHTLADENEEVLYKFLPIDLERERTKPW